MKAVPHNFGCSLSLKQCRNFGLDPQACLKWAINDAGFRRFRLMSYWDEIEKQPGAYDFSDLDRQIITVSHAGGVISLCLGVKQPRWPEYHWPTWTTSLSTTQRNNTLLVFIKTVVERYQNEASIISWQLENEALLSNFGKDIQIDRSRLKSEYKLIKQLDPYRPIGMSTSNGWGIPIRQPIPDLIGFSYYAIMFKEGSYHHTIHRPWLYKFRRYLIDQLLNRPVFLHELQCEPWGQTAIWKMSETEQNKSMSSEQIAKNLHDAVRIGAYPIDLWGLEWWYWRLQKGDSSIWQAVNNALNR